MRTTTPEPGGEATPPGGARHTPVIAAEVTTEIPVHLLFRDDLPGGPSRPIPLRPAVISRPTAAEQPRTGDGTPVPPAAGPHSPPVAAPRPVAAPGVPFAPPSGLSGPQPPPSRTEPEPRTGTGPEPRTATGPEAGTAAPSPAPLPTVRPAGPRPRTPAAGGAGTMAQTGPARGADTRALPGNPRAGGTAGRPLPGPAAVPPVACPEFTERPGPVLPGWTGVVAGACALAGTGAVLWGAGALPAVATRLLGLAPYPYQGLGPLLWALVVLGVFFAAFALGGLGRGRAGHARVLTLFGEYRGTVRRTGLMWTSPLLTRRPVDVRLRHWRSEPMPAVDADGTALRVAVLVVWRVRDTAKAVLGLEDHEGYLAGQVESALARVVARTPADALGRAPGAARAGTGSGTDAGPGRAGPSAGDGRGTLRDAEAVGEALTRVLAAECAAAGIEVCSARPAAVEYPAEVAAAMQRRRVAAIEAGQRETVLTSVVDAVDDTVGRLTARGLVELDDYERKALVRDLTVAFYTGGRAVREP
jgi:regulator of protease activity HflC (stomatin/prohibitin superfamily)